MKSGSLVIIIMSTPGNSSMQSLSVLIHFPNGERPIDKEDEAKTDVGKEFARFLQANSGIVGSVFIEQVLSRNTKLESDNKQLWKLVWKEYGPEQLRQAIVRYNVKGWKWHCDVLHGERVPEALSAVPENALWDQDFHQDGDPSRRPLVFRAVPCACRRVRARLPHPPR